MIICSFVKIITTHTHTHIQIHFILLLSQLVVTLATHPEDKTTSNLPRGAYIFIHTQTKYRLYDHTQFIRKYNLHKHKHMHTHTRTHKLTHKELYTILPFI